MDAPHSSSSDPERLADVVGEALERAPTERRAFLDAACAGAPELRAEAESLLRAHEEAEAGTFLKALDAERGAALL
ncbi:MAG: hypothetical protein ACRD0X_01110, partial [Thermoanaerobaculia bacterium]